MQLRLKSLFILIAIAAAISSWLATRKTPLYPGALVQIVDGIPGNDNPVPIDQNAAFENAFYQLLVDKLAAQQPKIIDGMSDPNAEIRDVIRLESMSKSDKTELYSVNAWGNALTSDREQIKTIMKIAVQTLDALSKDKSRASKTKILNLPPL